MTRTRTPHDYAASMRTMAQFLRNSISSAIMSPMEPLDWQSEIQLYSAMLHTMEQYGRIWQENIEHEAELAYQAEMEENAVITNGLA